MTECKQVYRCEICGNIVEVVHAGKGQLSCCGQPMKHMSESIKDGASEKHVPVIEKICKPWFWKRSDAGAEIAGSSKTEA